LREIVLIGLRSQLLASWGQDICYKRARFFKKWQTYGAYERIQCRCPPHSPSRRHAIWSAKCKLVSWYMHYFLYVKDASNRIEIASDQVVTVLGLLNLNIWKETHTMGMPGFTAKASLSERSQIYIGSWAPPVNELLIPARFPYFGFDCDIVDLGCDHATHTGYIQMVCTHPGTGNLKYAFPPEPAYSCE
jgi:hypothetical protein